MAEIAILAVSAVMALNKGQKDKALAYEAAGGIRDAAMRKKAATTAEVGQGKRLKETMASRAIALAAFGGGGVDDPSIQMLVGDLNAEGEYRILSRLYVGMSEAAGLEFQSEQAMRTGDAAMDQGYMNAVTTVLSKYGSYGDMWKSAKKDFGSIKGVTWDKMPWSHTSKAARASLGMVDYAPQGSAAFGTYA